ncbi:MAG: 50S ribosomal protein L35 [Armatimonadota bacterium]
MPKMKTRKCAAKRMKVTSTGRILTRSPKQNHLLSKKSRVLKRRLRLGSEITGAYKQDAEALLPYS